MSLLSWYIFSDFQRHRWVNSTTWKCSLVVDWTFSRCFGGETQISSRRIVVKKLMISAQLSIFSLFVKFTTFPFQLCTLWTLHELFLKVSSLFDNFAPLIIRWKQVKSLPETSSQVVIKYCWGAEKHESLVFFRWVRTAELNLMEWNPSTINYSRAKKLLLKLTQKTSLMAASKHPSQTQHCVNIVQVLKFIFQTAAAVVSVA